MKKKFPIHIQPDAMDCGPACLQMICSFYGCNYSLDFLRKNTFIGKDGVSLLGIGLSTVKNADQIVALDNGQIVEQGNHESLVQLKGKYYHLVKNQLELGA